MKITALEKARARLKVSEATAEKLYDIVHQLNAIAWKLEKLFEDSECEIARGNMNIDDASCFVEEAAMKVLSIPSEDYVDGYRKIEEDIAEEMFKEGYFL